MPNLGLYLGSFQPFHNDHLKHLKFILTQNDRCLIIIVRQEDLGSACLPGPGW